MHLFITLKHPIIFKGLDDNVEKIWELMYGLAKNGRLKL